MNEENIIDTLGTDNNQLPPFLNVLTILTFIGSGWAVLSSIWGFITIGQLSAQMDDVSGVYDELGEQMSENGSDAMGELMGGMGDMLEKTIANAPTLYTINIIIAIACIFGAFQMRKLQKTGFYIYTASCIIGVIAPLLILGGGLLTGAGAIAGGFFSLIFIILYGVNLKHMK